MKPLGLRELARRGTVHFMGVGGAGMAPLAQLVLASGGRATGCDLQRNKAVVGLEALGLEFFHGHSSDHLKGVQGVVATAAIPEDEPELAQARKMGLPIKTRAAALADWVNEGRLLCVAGTHGKTTTTALATHLLAKAGHRPTGIVGGEVSGWGGNLKVGDSNLFVVEADEFNRSFHALRPSATAITNLEFDHPETYASLAELERAFEEYLDRVRQGGVSWLCGDDHALGRIAQATPAHVRTFGLSAGCQLAARSLRRQGDGLIFDVLDEGHSVGSAVVPMPGRHSVRNALAAFGLARTQGAAWKDLLPGLSSFPGIARRFQTLGSADDVTVVDDYAHHPTEIRATLQAARSLYADRRLIAVFQPHMYSRTAHLAREFALALSQADAVWVTGVFGAREDPVPGVSAGLIAGQLTVPARRCEKLSELAADVARRLEPGDVCVVMGAGSVDAVGPEILNLLRLRTTETEVK